MTDDNGLIVVPELGVDHINFAGYWGVELIDDNGNVVSQDHGRNTVTKEGKSNILQMAFNGATQPSGYYIALIENANIGTIDQNLTYAQCKPVASGGQFTEWDSFASPTVRREWTPSAEASQSVTNASGTIDIQKSSGATESIYGFAIVANSSVVGDYSDGTAWVLAASQFSTGVQSVQLNYTLKLTYTFQA